MLRFLPWALSIALFAFGVWRLPHSAGWWLAILIGGALALIAAQNPSPLGLARAHLVS